MKYNDQKFRKSLILNISFKGYIDIKINSNINGDFGCNCQWKPDHAF